MRILHVTAECYPAAKAGGLGDVAGALPKYLNNDGHDCAVIIPGYHTPWILKHTWEERFAGSTRMGGVQVPFRVLEVVDADLGFTLFSVDVPGLFDRNGVYNDPETGYGYADEVERYIAFQQAVLRFVQNMGGIDILHCHDHHTGLIPFMVKHCPEFRDLSSIPTVFTIHNGQYHGAFAWDKAFLLPWFDAEARGLLDWANWINPMATGIKCCWRLTTVSNGYLEELQHNANGLESLLRQERMKSAGIVNGIDSQVWDPSNDPMITAKLGHDVKAYKAANKATIASRFQINPELLLITFIGRLVYEKGADMLPEAIARFLYEGGKAAFVVLGTGDPRIREAIVNLKHHFVNYFDTSIEYNETLSHQLYAGSDFLVMPSRVEPCGLNQLYAFRYGTIPIVRTTGGLAETVRDISEQDGNGLRFNDLSVEAISNSFHRAVSLANDADLLDNMRQHILNLDFSWEKATEHYIRLYQSLKIPTA
jgi:starch synthase